MVITLKDSTSVKTAVVLVHGAGRASDTYAQGPIGEEVFETAAMVQSVSIIRAAASRVRSRGNRASTYPFGALRVFASATAARAWAAAHAASLDGYDRLEIADGGSPITLHGVLSPIRCAVRGVAVEISYTFTFGAVS